MRNMLALVGAAVVVVAGLGWYLGWYRIEAESAAPGYRSFDVDINTAKISQDLKQGKDKLSKALAGDGQPTAAPPARPVEAQPTGRTGLQFNDDGSISYTGNVTLPPLIPGRQQ